MEEWTDPADCQKEVFFRNLSSIILDCTKDGPPSELWLNLQLFVIFNQLDNWPVFVDLGQVPVIGRLVEWVITHVVLLVATVFGKFFGYRGVYEEYTPRRLFQMHNNALAETAKLK